MLHLRECFNAALLCLDMIAPTMFISFLTTLCNSRNGSYLGRSSYQQRRSSLFHLFGLHNRVGFSSDFSNEMSDLYKGLFQVLTHTTSTRNQNRNHQANANQPNANQDPDGGAGAWASDDSKVALSVQLLCAVCGWLLDWETNDGVFAHCFLLI